jgi:uncharacterized protein
MKKIGLFSDTHSHLEAGIFEHFADCDEIWHAGDFGSLELVDKLLKFNIDNATIRLQFPETLAWECDGMKVAMIHIGGYPGKYTPKAKELIQAEKPHLFISGHSHILKIVPDHINNLLHINPGACGLEGWHQVKTLVKFDVDEQRLKNVQVIELR